MSGGCGRTSLRGILYILLRERLLFLLLSLLQFSLPKVFQVTFPCLPPIWSSVCWDYRCVPLHPAVCVLRVLNSGCQACVANTDSQKFCHCCNDTFKFRCLTVKQAERREWGGDLIFTLRVGGGRLPVQGQTALHLRPSFKEVKGIMTRTIRIVILSPSSNCPRIKWENESYTMILVYIYCKLSSNVNHFSSEKAATKVYNTIHGPSLKKKLLWNTDKIKWFEFNFFHTLYIY